ncbi:MAG: UDP-N-acetylmuramoyl-tripeptide--D-alanyl-D-alanine ligase [Phycicoccus sp.]|nr:UDP-N-acetylmuramoyl-tripeptide--D-alanyl-D-alanine ligase [Phycicoccus sp.]NMM33095.1 UDP-N-acetylmuramoyl-tripeptide--D-alanyl-D-alanine ligase [Phycicoccus sp.]
MIPLRLSEIARITGGEIHDALGGSGADPLVDGPVVTDSREASVGSLYVARVGEALDGHQFVAGARARGAVAALTSRPVDDLPCVVVADVQAAFVALASALIEHNAHVVVIAITGSSGKTSTKDLLLSVLQRHGETVANVGSLNSEVGVPLTVCRITATTAFLVLEMGARAIGHLAYLTRMAPPQIGVVLNVGTAHVGEFGSQEAIGTAKAELVQALPATGFAVLNADDPIVSAMAGQTRAHVIPVGESTLATVRAVDISLDPKGRASFTLVTDQGSAPVALGLYGEHHVGNALAVAAVALAVGMTPQDVATALGGARPLSRWRMEVHERADGVTIVNDAYNANPESMRAALKTLAIMGKGRRTWAVLGEMRELGDGSTAEHEDLGRLAIRLNVSRVVAVGERTQPIHDAAQLEAAQINGAVGEGSTWVRDVDAAFELLRHELRPGDVVLVKSSHDAGLRLLGDRLVDDGLMDNSGSEGSS